MSRPTEVLVVDTTDGTTTSFARYFGIVFTDIWQDRRVDLGGDGAFAAFSYSLDDLGAGDSNEVRDVFVIQLQDWG